MLTCYAMSNAKFSNLTLGTSDKKYSYIDPYNDGVLSDFGATNGTNIVFENVTNYVNYLSSDIYVQGYGSAFLGGYGAGNCSVSFKDCTNSGDIKLYRASSFIGNSSRYSENTYSFSNCKITGVFQGYEQQGIYLWGIDESSLTGIDSSEASKGDLISVKETIDKDNLVDDASDYLLSYSTYVAVHDKNGTYLGTILVRDSNVVDLNELNNYLDTSVKTYTLDMEADKDNIELKDGSYVVTSRKAGHADWSDMEGNTYAISSIRYCILARDSNKKAIAMSKANNINVSAKQ